MNYAFCKIRTSLQTIQSTCLTVDAHYPDPSDDHFAYTLFRISQLAATAKFHLLDLDNDELAKRLFPPLTAITQLAGQGRTSVARICHQAELALGMINIEMSQ